MIKVAIADDHKIVLEGLTSLIESEANIEVVGKALNGQKLLEVLKTITVDVVVVDIEMPIMNGIEATRSILKEYPTVKVLVLTMYNTIGFIRKIAETGAHGYILKNKGKEELVEAIETVYEGKKYYGEEVTKTLLNSFRQKDMAGEIHLTRREKEVLKLIAAGHTTKEISQKLNIAPTTVETHRRNLIEKTGVANTKALVNFAVKHGYE